MKTRLHNREWKGDILQSSRIHIKNAIKQIVNYLAKQEKAVTLSQVLQEMSDYTPEIVLNAIQSLKRRCFLEDNRNDQYLSDSTPTPLLLKLDRTLETYVHQHNSYVM